MLWNLDLTNRIAETKVIPHSFLIGFAVDDLNMSYRRFGVDG